MTIVLFDEVVCSYNKGIHLTFRHTALFRHLIYTSDKALTLSNLDGSARNRQNWKGCQVQNRNKYTVLSLAKTVCTFLAERVKTGVFSF
jgi:hypothetical protein